MSNKPATTPRNPNWTRRTKSDNTLARERETLLFSPRWILKATSKPAGPYSRAKHGELGKDWR